MSFNKFLVLALCLAVTGCAHTSKEEAAAGAPPKVVPMPDPKVTQAWLDDYEPRLKTVIQDSNLKLERRENLLVITAPVDGSFNPKRPEMLLAVTLGPFSRIAKLLEKDPKTAVLVLGHGDASGASEATQTLSQQRAQSVASIFRLSGLQHDRLGMRGMGSMMPRAANDSAAGRALNRRVEILLTPRQTMVALLSKYSQPTPPVVELAKTTDLKPAASAATAKKAVPAKKSSSSKKVVVRKAAAKAPVKKAVAVKKPVEVAKKADSTEATKN